MIQRNHLCSAAILLVAAWTALSQEIRPGVSAGQQPESLPLPTQGYLVYLVGELHGIAENEEFELHYLKQLHSASGLRDVAIEEDAVYENDAQAFVDGKSDALPPSLCLRAGILYGIRRLNGELSKDSNIRVHLTDIDSPGAAIRRHLEAIQKRLNANSVRIPKESAIKQHGLETVAQLKRVAADSGTRSDLRTIEFSILAYQQGLEVDIGPPKGSPYLDSREQAVAANIEELIGVREIPSLLVVYGSDHVSRTPRKDGGPNRDKPFLPMALRLEQAGIKAFSVITFPLSGRSLWRGQNLDFPWTAADGHLASGETLDQVLAAVPGTQFLYIDTKSQRARLPSQDISNMVVDAFVLFRSGGPMKNYCGSR
jgi:hypothetical protein